MCHGIWTLGLCYKEVIWAAYVVQKYTDHLLPISLDSLVVRVQIGSGPLVVSVTLGFGVAREFAI